MIKQLLFIVIFFSGLQCMTKEPIAPDIKPPHDQEILMLVYQGPKFPAGFETEKRNDLYVLYAVENNPAGMELYRFESSASNSAEAKKIASEWLKSLGVQGDLKDGSVTDKYFEFISGDGLSVPKRAIRIHKSSYVSNVKYNWQEKGIDIIFDDISGLRIGFETINTDNIKMLFDYLWLIRFRDTDGSVMAVRQVAENSNNITYTAYTVKTVFGDFGMNDKLYLIKSVYQVNKKNKSVSISHKIARQIEGRSNSGR